VGPRRELGKVIARRRPTNSGYDRRGKGRGRVTAEKRAASMEADRGRDGDPRRLGKKDERGGEGDFLKREERARTLGGEK